MTTRLYDYIITVSNAAPFRNGNNFIGLSSGTFGYIANVNTVTNNIKVKVNNVFQEYSNGESVVSTHYRIANTVAVNKVSVSPTDTSFSLPANVRPAYESEISLFRADNSIISRDLWYYDNANALVKSAVNVAAVFGGIITIRKETGNVASPSFAASNLALGNAQNSASTTILAINNSPFIRSKNAFTQPPIVRLLTLYYPGEWYPPNEKGNPSGDGAGLSWPADMPWRIAEVIGDVHSDMNYNVTFAGQSYVAYPMEMDGIGTSSDGTIDRVTVRISNYDNFITNLVENPYLVGNVTSNVSTGIVNGELVTGLDPATVNTHRSYNQNIVDTWYGRQNVAWSYERAVSAGETWKNLKYDSRDFLGGVVEVKSTFASHLQYWPEHSKLKTLSANLIQVYNSAPYRIGDRVTTPTSNTITYVTSIIDDNYIILSNNISNAAADQSLFIVNQEYDPEAYVKDVFKVTELTALNENFAEFSLTSWLQYFKLQLPKRKFYKNTCQWEYRGSECQYPGPNGGPIPGTFPGQVANTNPITSSNEVGLSASQDECAKSYQACKIRNNTIHFGGFPGTGRQVPKQ